MQVIQAQVPIPEDYVLVPKDEYQKLLESEYLIVGDMKWLKETTGIKNPGKLSKILHENREVLEEFVRYPNEGVGHWGFIKKDMTEWIKENWEFFS